jgi:hypothetical protein
MNVSDRLKEMGLHWPDTSKPPSYYYQKLYGDKSLAAKRAGDLLFITALPLIGGETYKLGRIGADMSLGEGYECARRAAAAALYEMEHIIGGLDRIEFITQLIGFIASAPGFTDQPKTLNGASDVLVDVLGDKGEHSRAAIGCVCLPGNNAVELVLTVKVKV